jgi:F-type H+-transporting ATPase subunit a
MLHFSISGEKIFEILKFEITNTFFLTVFLTFFLILGFYLVFRKGRIIPTRIQNFFEWILESFFNFLDSITGSRKRTEKIFPLATTLFLLILSANLLELIPGLGVFKILRSPSADLNFTLGLALFSIFYINFLILKELGILKFLKRFISKNPIFLFVGFLEFLSEITRILSLSFRLYGNLLAGEVLLIISSFLFAFLLPLPFLFLEILVGFIQAFIFSFLVVIFYSAAFQEHGEKR